MTMDRPVLVTGGTGLVGSAVSRALTEEKINHISVGSAECDLRDFQQVERLFDEISPQRLVLCAARVGGVLANSTYPATFMIDNLLMEANVLRWVYENPQSINKIIFLGSSCIYPKNAPLPLHPSSLLCGPLEETNKWYALAKLAGIYSLDGLSKQFGISSVSLLPTNLYGPGDNFHLEDGHVLPSLIKKFVDATDLGKPFVEVWGTGRAIREFLFVDDLARAVLSVMMTEEVPPIVNVGSGVNISIKELAELVSDASGFHGEIRFDTSKPDGAPLKPLDNSEIMRIGWKPEVSLELGLRRTVDWYRGNRDSVRNVGVIK